jgi:GTP cyclohydrolase I
MDREKKSKKQIQEDFKKRNPNAGKEAAKRYRKRNPEKVKAISKKYRQKYYTDAGFRITSLLRSRTLSAFKGKVKGKSDSILKLLGCTIEEFKKHIERQFQPGMSWANQGEWHFDHIIPCSKFDLTDEAQANACFHYTNYQPLWGVDNIKKGNKVEMQLLKKSNGCIPRTEAEKQYMIAQATISYGKFLDALGIEWKNDPHAESTPKRVAKAFINDLIWGCVNDLAEVTIFPNTEKYTGLICQTRIPVRSLCSHHHLTFSGVAHVAYIPGKDESGCLIGLSKLNRIVDWYSRRPNVQESLTKQIHDKVSELCINNRGVAVVIESTHNCVACRGVKHDSVMKTSQLSGYFHTNEIGTRQEFFNLIDQSRHS